MTTTRMTLRKFFAALSLSCLFALPAAQAAEQPAGEPIEKNDLQVMAVYLQPVEMAPAMADQDPAQTDIHLEADIHALQGNRNGFPNDAWMPYLTVRYTLTKKGSDWKGTGLLLPMVASDGPHYGANMRLDGPGAYELIFNIAPPDGHGFMHHTDKETGVAEWWPPFDYRGSFNFVGTGKKGAY
jgi:uncharacterized protein involved in high-affinity Fe2+ transport